MDLQLINQLIATVTTSNLRSFEVEENGFRLRLENNPQLITGAGIPMTIPAAAPSVPNAFVPVAEPTAEATETAAEIPEDESNFTYVTAPLVGIYYPLSSLNKENLKPGDKITAGNIVCAIEAMKLINEVKCDINGEFVEAMVEEGAEVEYGQPLLKLRKA